jgi:hypothetical protein
MMMMLTNWVVLLKAPPTLSPPVQAPNVCRSGSRRWVRLVVEPPA